jgi:ABC-type microcin C transport system duplicated ATPase subunit YejF
VWSIGATLREGLLVHRVRSVRQRVENADAMLVAVGLEPDAGRRYPYEFSGGQICRVALARILLLQPRLLSLDEPTSGPDMSVQATVRNLLRDIQRMFGLTYRFISRDLSVVRRLSDRRSVRTTGASFTPCSCWRLPRDWAGLSKPGRSHAKVATERAFGGLNNFSETTRIQPVPSTLY